MSNYASLLVIVGGVYNLLFGLFHISFWKLFNWRDELARMSPINRAVIQMLNIAVIVFLLMIAFVSMVYSHELVTTNLGRTLLLGTSIFWMARLVGEFTLKDGTQANPKLVTAFLVGILLYVLPMFN